MKLKTAAIGASGALYRTREKSVSRAERRLTSRDRLDVYTPSPVHEGRVFDLNAIRKALPGFVSPQQAEVLTSGRLSSFPVRESRASSPVSPEIIPFIRSGLKILYSRDFSHLSGKAQVIFFPQSYGEKPVTDREKHSLQVARIADKIGRELGLNEELIVAIALGHDLGHTPFGHNGEMYLSELCLQHGVGEFHHNVHSLEVADRLGDKGRGFNLEFQVRDGILFHDGETENDSLQPQPHTEAELQRYCANKKAGLKPQAAPGTLEGCVVRMADQIAYLPQDFEDAVNLGVFRREDLPLEVKRVLGDNCKAMVKTLVEDVVRNSRGRDRLAFSPRVAAAVNRFKAFNYENVYLSSRAKPHREKVKQAFGLLFEQSLRDLKRGDKKAPIYRDYLNRFPASATAPKPALLVRDYIASLTDYQFIKTVQEVDKSGSEDWLALIRPISPSPSRPESREPASSRPDGSSVFIRAAG